MKITNRIKRGSGILLHISSLPGPYGIGSLGKYARDFIDFLKKSGQKYWQVLPVGPTGFGDSPYQSFSSFSGNPYFIDLDILLEKNLLKREEIKVHIKNKQIDRVDYSYLYKNRFKLLKLAYERFNPNTGPYTDFIDKNKSWLKDYSLFMALKEEFLGKKWNLWPDDFKFREKSTLEKFEIENKREIVFYKFLQFEFFSQWESLKAYANSQDIEIIGDLPIYVAEDSADLWANPDLFKLNPDMSLKYVGGYPPDDFSKEGQFWGNPIYDWDYLEETDYSWWVKRLKYSLKIYDYLRLDHFIGFHNYWQIPGKDKTAKNGTWELGPGIKLFQALKREVKNPKIIAEDLGLVTNEVKQLREELDFPSMKILLFAFDPGGNSEYLPHNYINNCVVYTGTHDNDTILGWLQKARQKEINFAEKYFNICPNEDFNWGLIRGAMASVADLCVFQMQDLLYLDSTARMNNPGTIGNNWTWRVTEEDLKISISKKLKDFTKLYSR